MEIDIDRRVGLAGRVYIQFFDFCRAIGNALWRADPGAYPVTVDRHAMPDVIRVRRVGSLIVCGVEFRLVVIEVYARSFGGGRR